MKHMNEAIARSNVNYFPGQQVGDSDSGELNYLGQRLYEAGVIDMAPSTKPPGFYVNWTTVTGILALCVFIGGLFMFTWNTARDVQRREDEVRHLQERLLKAETDAAEAKKFSVYAAAGADEAAGHKPNQKEKAK